MTMFVKMYHPQLGNRQVEVPLQSVDDRAARGWLLVDGSTPAPSSPYLTPTVADSRYLRADDVDDPATPSGLALRAASVAAVVTAPEVRATYGRGLRPTGNLVAMIGTSLDVNAYAGQTTFVPTESPGWFNRLCHLSGGRIQKWGHLAVPGATTQQIHDLQLPQVLALNPRPHACIVGCGPNEAAAGPTTGWKALVTDICNQLRDAGIVPILKLEPPRGAQGSGNIADAVGTQQMNRWKQFYAAQQGIPTVDAYTPIAHVTGGITTAYNSGDGVHLTEAGYLALATDVVTRQKLPDLFPNPGLVTVKDLQDSTDILGGAGIFNGGAPGYTVYGTTAAIALASGSAGENIAGSWLKATRAAGTTGDSLLAKFLDMTGKAPGDAITAAMRFKTTGFTALTGAATYQASLHWTTGSGDVYQSLLDTTSRDTTDGLVVIRTTVPTGATDLQLDFTIKGATSTQVELYLAEVVMRNRTTLGIAA